MVLSRVWQVLLILAGCAAAGVSFAATETLTVNGVVIDTQSAQEHRGDLFGFVKNYPKENVIKNGSVSGYSLITPDGELTAFEDKSKDTISKFLRQPHSKIRVTVKARLTADKLDLLSIQNIKAAPKSPAPTAPKAPAPAHTKK